MSQNKVSKVSFKFEWGCEANLGNELKKSLWLQLGIMYTEADFENCKARLISCIWDKGTNGRKQYRGRHLRVLASSLGKMFVCCPVPCFGCLET